MRFCTCLSQWHHSTLHHTLQCSNFNWVTKCCACSVALRTGNIVGVETSLPHGAANAILLRGAVRSRHAGGSTILVTACANHDRYHIIWNLIICLDKKNASSFSS